MSLSICLMLILVVCIILIVLYNSTSTKELFNNPIVNLPAGDIHFIADNNINLIDIPIFNYKLGDKYLSVFHHKPFNVYTGIGQYVIVRDSPFESENIAKQSVLDKKCVNYLTSSPLHPIGYNLIWTSDLNIDNKIFSVWSPIVPSGCVTLGDVIVLGTEPPSLEYICCYPITMVKKQSVSNGIIWKAVNDMGKECYCWGAGNIDTFRCSNSYSGTMPELGTVYNLESKILDSNTVKVTNSYSTGITI